jgi:hypothetical protein
MLCRNAILLNPPKISTTVVRYFNNNKKDKIYLLIDVAIPLDRNVIQEENKNKLKHNKLHIEIQ